MKNLIPVLLFFAVSFSLYGQTEITKDSVPAFKLNDKVFDRSLIDTDSAPILNLELPDYRPQLKTESKPLDLDLPRVTYYNIPLINTNPINKAYPFVNDYSFYSGRTLSDRSWLATSSVQNSYPSLGSLRSVHFQLNYKPLNWLAVSGGAYGAKYHLFGNNYNDAGLTGAVKFILHDRIRINGYAQYSALGAKNGVGAPMMGMYPQSHYGGTLEVKITQKFGVEGGVIRELNPFNGKWVNRPYIAPVFYVK